jgi:hypothetical protein
VEEIASSMLLQKKEAALLKKGIDILSYINAIKKAVFAILERAPSLLSIP